MINQTINLGGGNTEVTKMKAATDRTTILYSYLVSPLPSSISTYRLTQSTLHELNANGNCTASVKMALVITWGSTPDNCFLFKHTVCDT